MTTISRSSWRVYVAASGFIFLIGLFAIIRTASGLSSLVQSDLANFILKSANDIVRGDPGHMYAVHGSAPYTTYRNDIPPLTIVLMAPLLKLADALGVASNYKAHIIVASVPFILAVPLLGLIVASALRSTRRAVGAWDSAVFSLIGLSPLTWLCVATWAHLEQPVMLCFLIASVMVLRKKRDGLAGVLAGLAILSGTAAVFPLISLMALLVSSRRRRTALLFGVMAAATIGIGMAPFLLVDPRDTLSSFLTWRGTEQIGGNTIWTVFTLDVVAGHLPHTLSALVRRLDTPAIVLVAAAAGVVAARRFRVAVDDDALWAVLAIGALGLPMLSKVMWPYYYFQPFILLLLYELSTLRLYKADPWRWPVLTGAFLVIASLFSQYVGAPSTGQWDRLLTGLLESGTMLVFVAAILSRVRALPPATAALPLAQEGGRTKPGGRTAQLWAHGRAVRRDGAV